MSDEDSAFPYVLKFTDKIRYQEGVTKREYFAAKMLQAIVSNTNLDPSNYDNNVKTAIFYADELIKELKKGENNADK